MASYITESIVLPKDKIFLWKLQCVYIVSAINSSGASSAQYQCTEILRTDSDFYGYTGATGKKQSETVAFKFYTICLDSHQDKTLAGAFICVLRNKGFW